MPPIPPPVELWLRGPIFDHAILGFSVDRTSGRASDLGKQHRIGVDPLELAANKMSIALTQALLSYVDDNPTSTPTLQLSQTAWIEAAKRTLKWKTSEAHFALELFEAMWNVEVSQKIPDVKSSPITAKALRFALFMMIQLYERPRRTSSLDSFNTTALLPESSSTNNNTTNANNGSPMMLGIGGAGNSPTATAATTLTTATAAGGSEHPDGDLKHIVLMGRRSEWSKRLTFVQKLIPHILKLFWKLCHIPATSMLPHYASDALGFILAASQNAIRVGKLSEAMSEAIQNRDGADMQTQLSKWLISNIKIDETRSPQWWAVSASEPVQNAGPMGAGARPVVVRNMTMHDVVVVANNSAKSSPTSTFVATCRGTTINISGVSTYAHIIGCTDTIVFLGPVTGVLTIEHCERVHVYAACGRLRLLNCVDTKVNCWTGANPVVFGDCRGIVIGPHCSRYANCTRLVESVCPRSLVTDPPPTQQLWRKPIFLDMDGIVDDVDGEEISMFAFAIQNVDDFYLEPTMGVNPADVIEAAPMPSDYAQRLHEKRTQVQSLMRRMHDTTKSRGADKVAEVEAEINGIVSKSFREWLATSGNIEEIVKLQRYEGE